MTQAARTGGDIRDDNMGRIEKLSLSRRKQNILPTEGFLYLPTNKGYYPEGAVNMLLAKRLNELVEATPQSVAECPHCHEGVISKCGSIKAWHWSHVVKCKYETGPETEWHIEWKEYAVALGCTIEKRFDEFIADIYVPDEKIVEVQHSQISPETILDRCNYYWSRGWQINWIFDYSDKKEHLRYTSVDDISFKLKQKWSKKTINVLFNAEGYPKYGRVYLDDDVFVNEEYTEAPDDFGFYIDDKVLFEVKKMYSNGNGWGKRIKASKVFGRDYFNGKYVGEGMVHGGYSWK